MLRLRTLRTKLVAALLGGLLVACSTYRSELHRGQRYYEENKYEAALALWRALEHDQDSLAPAERVRYAYFRGMTDYRLGYRSDARYWLSLAEAGEALHPASLTSEAKQRLEDTLGELNDDFASALASARAPADAEPASGTSGKGPSGAPRPDGFRPDGLGPDTSDPAGTPCEWTTECPRGYICQDRVCVEL